MKCSNCNAEVNDESNFCAHCGKKLKQVVNPWMVCSILLVVISSIGVMFLRLSNHKVKTDGENEVNAKDCQIQRLECQNDSILYIKDSLSSVMVDLEEKNSFLNSKSKPARLYVMPFRGNSRITFCNGVILDPGGTRDYPNNCDSYLVVEPKMGMDCGVRIQGGYNTESCDYIDFYERSEAVGERLARYSGVGECDVISRSGVCLIHFHTDATVVRSGFTLSVTCVPPEKTTNIPEYMDKLLHLRLRGQICEDKQATMMIDGRKGTYRFIDYQRTLKVRRYNATTGELVVDGYEYNTDNYIGKFEGTLTPEKYQGKFTNNSGEECVFCFKVENKLTDKKNKLL